MKKLSSSLLLLLSIVILMLSAGNVHANRAAAGEIAYSYLRKDSTVNKVDSVIIRVDTTKSPTGTITKIDTIYRFDTTFNFLDVYRLTYVFVRDCGGATAEPATVKVCYFNSCNADQGNVDLPKKTPLGANGQIVGNGCLLPATTCTNPASTVKGFRKWVYEGEVSLPSKCANWRFIVSITARNAGITNYTAPAASNNMFSEATLNNIIATNSSSPSFNLELIQYMCAGNSHNYAYGGVDADGDILEYTLIDPTTGADNQTTCVIPPFPSSYVFTGSAVPGTSLTTDPFGTTSSFNLSSSGVMTFNTPGTPTQQALMTMLVTKRRGAGGPVVGTVTRDIEFIISTGCTSSPVNFSYDKPASTATILWAGTPVDTAILCPDEPYHICFDIQSPDPSMTFSNVTDNHLTFSPTSGASTLPSPYTGEGTNHISNCFDWTPTPADEGTKYLVVKSEVCKPGNPKYYRLDTIFLEIIRTAYIETIDTFICFGEVATLEGFSQGAFGWETTSGGGIGTGTLGITSPFSKVTTVIPSATTTYLLRDTGIRGICARKDNPSLLTNQAEVKIVVVNPRIDAGPDTVMCSYSSLQLNANLLNPQPELTYKYSWTPGTWLDDSTISNPMIKFPPGTPTSSIPDSITLILKLTPYPDTTCFRFDTVKVYVLKGFYILTGDTLAGNTGLGHEGRQKGVSDTMICNGKSITLLGWGDPRYNYIWNPSTGVSTPTDFKSGMTITPADTGDLVFSLTAARPGCPDSTKQIRIRIDPNPTVNITDDQTICFGDTINLYAEITPDIYTFTKYKFNWAPGGALARADTFFTYFTGYRTEKIVFTVSTPAGCIGKDSAVYTVLPRMFLTPSLDTAICPGDSAQLHVVGDAKLQSVIWKPNTNIDSILSLNPIVNPVFTTDYVVVGLDSNRCVDSATIKVTVYPRALIYLPDTAKIYPGEIYQLDPQGNSLYYTWFPPIGLDNPDIANPKAQPLLNTMYTVRGISDAGCSAVDSIYIFVAPDSYIDVPNAFVPGRTGDNNVFKPVHLGDATLKSFTVYNRWGMKLFESNDMNKGWDGTYGGQPQPFGVYVYVLEAVTAKGKVITKQGNVTLVR